MLSELDDWMSDEESDREDGEGEEDDDDQPKKKKKKVQSKGRTQQGKYILYMIIQQTQTEILPR